MYKMSFDPFENKPDIAASSRHLYTHNLRKLNNNKEIKNLNFLSKPEILERLEGLNPNTKRTYIIAIVSSLRDRPEAKYKKLYDKFYKMLLKSNAFCCVHNVAALQTQSHVVKSWKSSTGMAATSKRDATMSV